jgi:integration host factor subunit beta
MTKSELIEFIATKTGAPKKLSEGLVTIVFDAMTSSLAQGERIEIRGFGAFTIREYKPYHGRNPKTGEKVYVPSKKLPFFKVGKELKERVTT